MIEAYYCKQSKNKKVYDMNEVFRTKRDHAPSRERLVEQLTNPDKLILYPDGGCDSTFSMNGNSRGLAVTLREVDDHLLRDIVAGDSGCAVFQTTEPDGRTHQYYVGNGVLAPAKKRIDGMTVVDGASIMPLADVPNSAVDDVVIGENWPYGSGDDEVLSRVALPWSQGGIRSNDPRIVQGKSSPTKFGLNAIQSVGGDKLEW